MNGQELTILFKGDKAYLTNDRPMTFAQLGLPSIAKRFKSPAYWKIRIINFNEFEKKIYCEILSYHKGEVEFQHHQQRLANQLNKLDIIKFRSIDTERLLITLSDSLVGSFTSPTYSPVEREPYYSPVSLQVINETFFIPLKNVHFKNGGVSIEKRFKAYKKTLELTISNPDIREEFDAVKNYFANVLRTKKIKVTVKIEIIDDLVTSTEINSPEIDRIDQQFVEDVKFELLRSLVKNNKNVDFDQSLFTMDDVFSTLAEDESKGNVFYSHENELFEDLLTISNTKHYRHLRFLSSKHQSDIMKLRFVHSPFSFLFLIRGDKNYHVVWETLDTEEATYIWHIQKDINVLKAALEKMNVIIKEIKVQGKKAYINSTEDPFERIYHDYSEPIDGFVKWKGELENLLT